MYAIYTPDLEYNDETYSVDGSTIASKLYKTLEEAKLARKKIVLDELKKGHSPFADRDDGYQDNVDEKVRSLLLEGLNERHGKSGDSIWKQMPDAYYQELLQEFGYGQYHIMEVEVDDHGYDTCWVVTWKDSDDSDDNEQQVFGSREEVQNYISKKATDRDINFDIEDVKDTIKDQEIDVDYNTVFISRVEIA